MLKNPLHLRPRAPTAPAFARVLRAASIAALYTSSSAALAQTVTSDSARVALLRAVSVTVTRDPARSTLELPFATTRLVPDAERPGLRRVSFGELLLGVPGVQVQDRANPSQDPRLSIRGFGARSAFGVRGVRVMRDGVPLTLPDGQTPMDWLDLESIGSVELVRGTAAALYGNAAGGVVDFRSRAPANTRAGVDARAWDGGGVRRLSALASGSVHASPATRADNARREAGWLASFTKTNGNGVRTWSRLDATSAFARALATVAGTRLEVQGTWYDTPRAENPGALTALELSRDPSLPDSLNITKHSRKAVRHSQVALVATGSHRGIDWTASTFTGTRSLDNPLPFAIVAVERRVAGASVRVGARSARTGWPVRLTAGADVQRQTDDRVNYENCADVPTTTTASTRCPTVAAERGALRLDQQERAVGLGVYARAEVEAPHQVFASVALRRDAVDFHVRDRFITSTNANDSGDRPLSAVSPMAALAWHIRPLWSVYANIATAFETPTVTELTNQDNGAAGLNTLLEPQRTRTMELGMQGVVAGRVRVDVSGFRAIVREELVPFDVPNAPGRRAFRNAGQTSRAGLEGSARASLPFGDAGTAYTWSRFRFDSYTVGTVSYAGKPIPGVPVQQLQSWVTLRRGGWFSSIEATAATRVSADDAATVFASGYSAWGWRAGYASPVVASHVFFEPVIGVDNVFDRHYASAVVINATRSRYFEPALRRRAYVSLRTGFR